MPFPETWRLDDVELRASFYFSLFPLFLALFLSSLGLPLFLFLELFSTVSLNLTVQLKFLSGFHVFFDVQIYVATPLI